MPADVRSLFRQSFHIRVHFRRFKILRDFPSSETQPNAATVRKPRAAASCHNCCVIDRVHAIQKDPNSRATRQTMEGEGEEDAEAAPSRWTCEACGCNTNLSTTERCGICGTNNSGEIPFRRVKSAVPKEFRRDFPGVFRGGDCEVRERKAARTHQRPPGFGSPPQSRAASRHGKRAIAPWWHASDVVFRSLSAC